jgi:hypothetical protein
MKENQLCPKCHGHNWKIGKMRSTGGFLSKIFDVQSRKFTTVTCRGCRYTEFYEGDTGTLGNVLDFFTS